MVGFLSFLSLISAAIFVVALVLLIICIAKKRPKKLPMTLALASFISTTTLGAVISSLYEPNEKPILEPTPPASSMSEQSSNTVESLSESSEKFVSIESSPLPSEASSILSSSQTELESSVEKAEIILQNPLMSAEVIEIPVMNGFKTERIGTAAYVFSDKLLLTEEYLVEFAEKRVSGKDYNWMFIKFSDDTAIFFYGSIESFASYGTLAEDNTLEEVIGDIFINIEERKCTYTART